LADGMPQHRPWPHLSRCGHLIDRTIVTTTSTGIGAVDNVLGGED
jgi:hypothetical protein